MLPPTRQITPYLPGAGPGRTSRARKKIAPQLTVIVIFYNMRREAPRTLYSMSAAYQQGVDASQYRVIAVDNGSPEPLDEAMVRSFGENFDYLYFKTSSKSPAAALNFCAQQAQTPYCMFMIDGARMLSPGLILRTLEAYTCFKNPFVYTLSLHLGHKLQNVSVLEGYCQAVEDALLESVDWRTDGYQLFSISNIENYTFSFFGRMPESNCFAVSKEALAANGGFDERFATSGGGLVNLEIFSRYVRDQSITPVGLIGEATFHQFHGGVSTNVVRKEHPLPVYLKEYSELFGVEYQPQEYHPCYWGGFNEQLKSHIPGSVYRQYLKIASRFTETGSFNEASALLQLMLKLDDTDPDVHNSLGNLYLAQGDYRAAERAYRLAVDQDYFSKGGRYVCLGNALKMQGRVEEAIEAYQLAVENRGGGAIAPYYLGMMEKQRGNLQLAIFYLERSLEINGEMTFAMIELGHAYGETGNLEAAMSVLKRAVQQDPRSVWAHLSLGGIYVRLGDEASARLHYHQAYTAVMVDKVKISARMCSTLGSRLLSLKEAQMAKELSAYGVEHCEPPQHAAVLFNLGWACKVLGDRSQATLYLTRALRKNHSSAFGYQMLAEIYQQNGDHNRSRLMLKKATLQDASAERKKKLSGDLARTKYARPDWAGSEYRSFIFTHIEKCAGGTVRQLLADAAYLGGLTEAQIHVPGELGQSVNTNLVQLTPEELEKVRSRDIRVLADHSPWGAEVSNGLSSLVNPFFFTMLREPLDRFLSYYYSVCYVLEPEYKGIHFKNLPQDLQLQLVLAQANRQVAYLSAMLYSDTALDQDHLLLAKGNITNTYTCFGVFEKLEASLGVLRSKAPKWLRFPREADQFLPRINAGGGLNFKEKAALKPEVVLMFEHHNRLDQELYAFARQLLQVRYNI